MPAIPRSLLDPGQTLVGAYDDESSSFRVKTNIAVAMDGSNEIVIDSSHDSIAIGNVAGQLLKINPDGSINVNVESGGSTTTTNVISNYNEVTSVPSGTETIISTYTANASAQCYLTLIEASGTNLAEFRLYRNSIVIDKKYSSYTEYNVSFNFSTSVQGNPGFLLSNGDVITLRVLQNQGSVSNNNARIQVLEQTTS